MNIRQLTEQDAELYRSIRLSALLLSPEPFGSSYTEEVELPLEEFMIRLRNDYRRFVLGAFVDDTIVGLVGLNAEKRMKLSHKATIWGMFVLPEFRGRGIAKSLMREAIFMAGSIEDVEQINLCVVSNNIEAKNLYMSLGFEVYGNERHALKNSDGNYSDEDYLVLFL